jgi:membrane protease YdiL (CAAX protease family)
MLVALVPVDYAVTAMSRRWFPPDDAQFEIFEALIPTGVWNVVIGVLGVIVLVPLAEELLFAGSCSGP